MRAFKILISLSAVLSVIAAVSCGHYDSQDDAVTQKDDGLKEILAMLNSYSDSGKYPEFLNVAKPLYDSAVSAGDEIRQVLFGTGVAEA